MALLLETTIGDLVIDLDVDGSPALCKNVLKLAKARYYTSNLVYNVQPNRFCQLGDPCGDGTGGACIYGVLDAYEKVRKNSDSNSNSDGNSDSTAKPDVLASQRRFLKSDMGRALTEEECRQRGRVVATEINGIPDTIGSQLLITVDEGPERSLDNFRNITATGNKESTEAAFVGSEGLTPQTFRSVGMVVEDDNDVLGKINSAYCDANGRPYADIRVIRALVIHDPYEDPAGMDQLLEDRGVVVAKPVENPQTSAREADDESLAALRHRVSASPDYERPPEETVEIRISASEIVLDDANAEQDQKKMRMLKEQRLQREDKSRAVVLEMLGDLPSADVKAPENVLFVCKLNSVTEDEDLELIFSRFDEKVSVEIVRDHKTGASLQYAFVEFTTKEKAAEAYFKMNNALVDDRRIKVDFSQSVAKVWDRFNQRHRTGFSSNAAMPRDPFHEQQQQGPRSRHENKGRNNDNRDDQRFSNNRQGSGHSRIHDGKQNSRDGRYHDRSVRERNSDRDRNHRDRDRSNADSRRRDRHSRQSGRDQTHFDRDRHDHRSRRPDEGRDRDRTRGSDRSRNRNDDYRRHESSSHRKDRKRRHDSDTDEYSESDRHGRSHSRNHRRQRKDKGDRRRRSRSRSRSSSSSWSGDDRREQRRSSGKTSRRKREKKSDEDKRYRRDRHHHHSHRSGSNRRRQSPSSSRS